jgi:hypothetical protein
MSRFEPVAALKALAVVCAALVLTGCASGNTVNLAPGYTYTLRAPGSGPHFTAVQEIVIQAPDGREERLVSQLENDSTSMRLAAFTPLGQTLLTVRFDGRSVETASPLPVPAAFDARFVLALIQLALWPENAVVEGLGVGVTLTSGVNKRELEGGGKILWTIETAGASVPYDTVNMHGSRLGLRITTLPE